MFCECWNLESCDDTESQRHWDHIDDLWKQWTNTEACHLIAKGLATWVYCWPIWRRCYHVIEKVHSPVERLADTGDVLEPLWAAVVLFDFIDGKTGCCDWVTRQHTYSHKHLEQSLNTVRKEIGKISQSRYLVNYLPPGIFPLYTLLMFCWFLFFLLFSVHTINESTVLQ